MHCFSDLFDKALYMFQTSPLSIIRSILTLYTQQQVFFMLKFYGWVKLLVYIHLHCG